MKAGAVTVSMLLVLSACAQLGAPGTTSATTSSTSPTPTSTLPPVVDCPGAGEFEEGGGIADLDGSGSDSARLGRVSWEESDRCETFNFDFETSEGAPATTTPDVQIDHLESFQVIRISIDVDSSVVIDQLVETDLVDRLYVVQALDGGMFVDLHLAAPAAARATALASPARLSVELRPGFVQMEGNPSHSDGVVLVSPTAEADVATTTQLVGYARTSEGDVLIVVTQAGTLVLETSASPAESDTAWGEFRMDLTLPPGEVSIFAGERSPGDGSLDGLTIDLSVS
jgi:Immunoglobulin-like domain of bacterial spore germination